MEQLYYWCFEITFLVSGAVYAYVRDRREHFWRRTFLCVLVYALCCAGVNQILPNVSITLRIAMRLIGWAMLIVFQYICWKVSLSVAVYDAVWAFITWQMIFEHWAGMKQLYRKAFSEIPRWEPLGILLIFLVGHIIAACTIARWMPEGGQKKIGPRQLFSGLLIFAVFEIIGLSPANAEMSSKKGEWQVLYLSQLLLAVVLYLQNELFKKSAMRQELAVMNLLWKKEQEQYQLSRENIALINQKCHDLKHQIRAIRNASKEDIDTYLDEMEDSIQIYESIVKTGNEVLDTILTEKSLYCRERGITVSCVADGSQMEFINTVDLYAILGNALDNAIEAVEKFKHKEKRQIDVLIYRQQNFLVMNIINPLKGNLVYEEELPVTTKGDKQYHGFGLRSMRYLVKKYDGFLNVSTEDGCFSLKILIPIPSGSGVVEPT